MHHPVTGHEIAVGYAWNAEVVVVQWLPLKVAADVPLVPFRVLREVVALTATQSALDTHDTTTAFVSGNGDAS